MLGSPVYGRLAERLAADPGAAQPIVGDDVSWDLGLRLFGAVHWLVQTGAAPDALSGEWGDFEAALDRNQHVLRRFVAEQGVQTNETQRCVALLPAFLSVARETGLPLDLLELGPSAGLNLLFDHYRYSYAEGRWGDPDARLSFDAVERTHVPASLLACSVEVRRRRGVDLRPVDAKTPEGVQLLRAFVWPGLSARMARLDAAIATLEHTDTPPQLIRGDYVELLPDILAGRPADAATVVFQTASTAYLTPEERARLRATLDAAGSAGAPLAWISSRTHEEQASESDDGWELELRIWPDEGRLVALVDYHGNWIDWVDA
jgi:hypothetical protein